MTSCFQYRRFPSSIPAGGLRPQWRPRYSRSEMSFPKRRGSPLKTIAASSPSLFSAAWPWENHIKEISIKHGFFFFHRLNCTLEHVFPYFSTRGLFGFSPPSNLARARPRLMLGPISASGLLGELGAVVLVTSSWEFFLETRLKTQSPSSEQAGIMVMLSSSLPAERTNEEQNDNRMLLKQEGKYSNGKICSIAQMKDYSMCIVFHFIYTIDFTLYITFKVKTEPG